VSTKAEQKGLIFGAIIESVATDFFADDGLFGAVFYAPFVFVDNCIRDAKALGIDASYSGVMAHEGTVRLMEGSELAFDPPVGTTREQLDEWGVTAEFRYVWLVRDGRHYDALNPHGVDHPMNLTYLRHVFVDGIGKSAPQELENLKAQHAWWAESARLSDMFKAHDEQRKLKLAQDSSAVIIKISINQWDMGMELTLAEFAQKLNDDSAKEVLLHPWCKHPIEKQGDEPGWPLKASYDSVVALRDRVQLHIKFDDETWKKMIQLGFRYRPLEFQALLPRTIYGPSFDILKQDMK
jgi:hypothetical protein